ncbi:helix-turn-helix transcriptional regulator [Amorphus sp. 3PC139-8]|uniref:helix-turn-helix transcriptional regulator n=1 Tax=Amorphus sp. 3PC139-8 TaxID=2735676 RepID=UPI00345DBC24
MTRRDEGGERAARCVLPPSLPPRGLSRVEAARYIGVSPTTFDQLIAGGLMPGPKRIRRRTVWDRVALDRSFEMLPAIGPDEYNPWD